MALIVIATAGGATSNSYCTVAEANTYHESRLHNEPWDNAGADDKSASVVWATRMLDDQYDWDGSKSTEAQALRWPRTGLVDQDGYSVDDSTIPQFLIDATSELARLLIEEDRRAGDASDEFSRLRVSSIELYYREISNKVTIPDSVHDFLRFYGVKYDGVDGGAVVSLIRT